MWADGGGAFDVADVGSADVVAPFCWASSAAFLLTCSALRSLSAVESYVVGTPVFVLLDAAYWSLSDGDRERLRVDSPELPI